MNKHQKIIAKLDDYVRNSLSEKEYIEVAEHLANCEKCQEVLDKRELTRSRLRDASEMNLKPASRLRLYEKLNEERHKKGEKLLRVPKKLIAQAKAKGEAMAEAVGDVAKAGGQSANQMHALSGQVIHTMKDGAKSVGDTALDAGKKSALHGKDMVDETVQTMVDSGRAMTSEVADVVKDTVEHPLKTVVAPVRLAGKGIKAGGRMAKGSAKIATSGVKGVLTAAKGGLDIGAESMKQSGKTLDAMFDILETAVEERDKVMGEVMKGVKKTGNAKPDDEKKKD